MRITIDNEDGLGPVDYTSSVLSEAPISIQRSLNAPTRCTAEVLLGLHGLAVPARKARVVVTNVSESILFTGYLAVEAAPVYAGTGTHGPVYRAILSAISDEWLLDKQGSGASASVNGLILGQSGTASIAQMTQVVQSTAGTLTDTLTVSSGGDLRAIGAFAVDPSTNWTTNAGAVANATYASYRAVNGSISVLPAGTATHVFSDADGTLNVAELSAGHLRELVNDVTLSGSEEPAAYVQEVFSGDGTTSVFELSQAVFRGANATLLRDNFNEPSFDLSQWQVNDPSSSLQLTSSGLTMKGGTGIEGQTTLTAVRTVEMGGFLLAQLGGVVFGAASEGVIGGLYSGGPQLGACFAGFRVRQSVSANGGVTLVVPVVNGVEIGSTFTPVAGHSYTLRLRLYCVEMLRIPQQYYCMVDGVVQEFGSGTALDAPQQVVFEVLDEGVSSNTPVTVLYDSAAAGTPLSAGPSLCNFVAVDAVQFYGSIASLQLTRPGSAWVESVLPNGTTATRLLGVSGQGVDCKLSYGGAAGSPGKLSFFAGRIPVAGERISITYRTSRRAVARLADPVSALAEVAAGSGIRVPGLSRWLGRVEAPIARSSADCEAAAMAVLAMASARTAALAGTYSTMNPPQDIWPGDVLAISSAGQANSFLVRSVVVRDCHAVPECLNYGLTFANDWAAERADGFGLKLGESIATDAWLPPSASSGLATFCANLQQLEIVSLSGTAIQVDAGVDPPAGGGFEVRLRDWAFGPGIDVADLVLRSPVRSFSLPRAAQSEEFFIRMYDGGTPAAYSRFSSVLIVNWPMD